MCWFIFSVGQRLFRWHPPVDLDAQDLARVVLALIISISCLIELSKLFRVCSHLYRFRSGERIEP